MATVSVHEAETQLAALIDRAARGKEAIFRQRRHPAHEAVPGAVY